MTNRVDSDQKASLQAISSDTSRSTMQGKSCYKKTTDKAYAWLEFWLKEDSSYGVGISFHVNLFIVWSQLQCTEIRKNSKVVNEMQQLLFVTRWGCLKYMKF